MKVKSFNEFCESKFNAYNKVGQVTVKCPKKMKAPTSLPSERTRTSIAVKWEDYRAQDYLTQNEIGGPGMSILGYQVGGANEGEVWQERKQKKTKTGLVFTQNNLKDENLYRYRVRAANEVCWGEWSEEATFRAG